MEFVFKYDEDIEKRVDFFLSEKLEFSRSLIASSIKEKKIVVNGNFIKPSYKLINGDIVSGIVVENKILIKKNDIPLDILFEDEYLMVINKAYGISVHPSLSDKADTVVGSLITHTDNLSDVEGEYRRGIVHRLDKDTSGALIIAKDNKTHYLLKEMFQNRKIEKKYLAICSGTIKEDEFTISSYIGRDKYNKTIISSNTNYPKLAKSKIKLISKNDEYLLLEVEIFTGRTHQIRVQLSENHIYILGDKVYGRKKEKIIAKDKCFMPTNLNFIIQLLESY